MMDLLADSWVLMMIIFLFCVIGLIFYRQGGRGGATVFTSAEDFSLRTIFLNFQKGEGDLFFGFLIGMFTFSLFILGFTRWLSIMIG